MMRSWGRYAGVVCDIDGVLCRGDVQLPGAAQAVRRLRETGAGLAFVTNNAFRTPEQATEWLGGLGVAVEPGEVVTSAMAAAGLLEPGTRCLMIGVDGLRAALEERGCPLVEAPEDAEAVVVGFSPTLVWDDLRRATLALGRGARFLACNTDPTLPVADGLWPGNGAIVAALATASGRKPEVAGKPEAALFEAAAARLPTGPLLMVGDRLDTDIAGAAALGWDTALVLTGVTDAEAAREASPAPTMVASSLATLVNGASGAVRGARP